MKIRRTALAVGLAVAVVLLPGVASADPQAPAPGPTRGPSEADTLAPGVELGSLLALDGVTRPSDELVAARDALVKANTTAEHAAEDFNAATAELAEARERERAALLTLAAARVREVDAHRALGRFASEAYIAGGASANVAALLDAPTPTGLVQRRNAMSAAGTASADLVAELERAQQDARTSSSAAAEARVAASDAQAQARAAHIAADTAAGDALELLSTMFSQEQLSQAARQAQLDAATLREQLHEAGVSDMTKPTKEAKTAVAIALEQVGKPYVWGAEGPDTFDCSGLTSWAYAKAGVTIPRVSRDQFAALAKVTRADMAPGDLVFFGAPVHHVGMYIGGGMMVHAPHPGDVVRVAPAFWSDFVGAARPSVASGH